MALISEMIRLMQCGLRVLHKETPYWYRRSNRHPQYAETDILSTWQLCSMFYLKHFRNFSKTFTFVLQHLYKLITAPSNASEFFTYFTANSSTQCFFRCTKQIYNFICFVNSSSCIIRKIKTASIETLTSITQNLISCIGTTYLNYFQVHQHKLPCTF